MIRSRIFWRLFAAYSILLIVSFGLLGWLLVAQDTSSRITLIRADGRVLADSGERLDRIENHLDRIEVQQAEAAGLGMATRYSGTVHRPMMYVARKNETGPVRYVRIALPLD